MTKHIQQHLSSIIQVANSVSKACLNKKIGIGPVYGNIYYSLILVDQGSQLRKIKVIRYVRHYETTYQTVASSHSFWLLACCQV